MRSLRVKKSMHRGLLLLLEIPHVQFRMSSLKSTILFASIHVNVHLNHRRLVQWAHTRLDCPLWASSMKTWALVMRVHAHSWLVKVFLSVAKISVINLWTELFQPKHTSHNQSRMTTSFPGSTALSTVYFIFFLWQTQLISTSCEIQG